jgi:hypothetical protein
MKTVNYGISNKFPSAVFIYQVGSDVRGTGAIAIARTWEELSYYVVQALLDENDRYYIKLGDERIELTDEGLFKKIDQKWPQTTRFQAMVYLLERSIREGTEEDVENALKDFNKTYPDLKFKWIRG